MDRSEAKYRTAVVNSALWAAAGDALGWITELSRGEEGVRFRSGLSNVEEPVRWKRKIGGQFGVRVDLPAGTYSDDTQLRLAVGRCIRGNGEFDLEAFAKLELTVWQSYSLGAGIGSKAAASNLARRDVNWFSNFFKTDQQRYVSAGGNGAAMRVQPHVWSSRSSVDDLVLRVFMDSIVTHGDPHGFCGAIFHAVALNATLRHQKHIMASELAEVTRWFKRIPSLVDQEPNLSSFWRPHWERERGQSLKEAVENFTDQALRDIEVAERELKSRGGQTYQNVLAGIGAYDKKFRGSGFKTALAASVIVALYGNGQVEAGLVEAANQLQSDTDTIATMAGAILGGLAESEPRWEIQDREYIAREAGRLANIGLGRDEKSFAYPDLATWSPPSNQSDAVGYYNEGIALVGFGRLEPVGPEYEARDAIWQWCRLPHGQSILVKRRTRLRSKLEDDQVRPVSLARPRDEPSSRPNTRQQALFDEAGHNGGERRPPIASNQMRSSGSDSGRLFPGMDEATKIAINSGFDERTIGELLLRCTDHGGIELAIGFASIVAKARLARRGRGS